jgi:hypothetical protein
MVSDINKTENQLLAGRTSERLPACKILEKVDKMPSNIEDPENGYDRLDKTLLAMKLYADQEVNAKTSLIMMCHLPKK